MYPVVSVDLLSHNDIGTLAAVRQTTLKPWFGCGEKGAKLPVRPTRTLLFPAPSNPSTNTFLSWGSSACIAQTKHWHCLNGQFTDNQMLNAQQRPLFSRMVSTGFNAKYRTDIEMSDQWAFSWLVYDLTSARVVCLQNGRKLTGYCI